MPKPASQKTKLRAIELFAGVGGFRLGLEQAGWEVVWANQWEPPRDDIGQFAYDCYVQHFDPQKKRPRAHSNRDIAKVLDDVVARKYTIPTHDLLVGGFPCQDYSVAKPLSQAEGIRGKKGVLWWEIHRLLELKKPKYVLLENVDRLLKSPADQRGRDFAVILACFRRLKYRVEWRVVNAAEYGLPQRRRRIFIFAEKMVDSGCSGAIETLVDSGVLARALPVMERNAFKKDHSTIRPMAVELPDDVYEASSTIGVKAKTSPFKNAGVMCAGEVLTMNVTPEFVGPPITLGVIASRTPEYAASFLISDDQLERWKYLKGAKSEPRINKATNFAYRYSEGSMSFPDPLNRPSRTILTGEGGTSASRFKHAIETTPGGPLRRLIPEELEDLNGFPRGWTDTGMSDVRRAFCMGNALVVGIVERIGREIRIEAERP